MKVSDLPVRTRRIFRYIEKCCEAKSPPSIREIGDKYDLSPQGVVIQLNALEDAGFIVREKRRNRAIALSPEYKYANRGVALLDWKLV